MQNKSVHENDMEKTLVPLSFKVPKEFKKRYQRAAIDSELKLNELLAAMLDLWEEKKQ